MWVYVLTGRTIFNYQMTFVVFMKTTPNVKWHLEKSLMNYSQTISDDAIYIKIYIKPH